MDLLPPPLTSSEILAYTRGDEGCVTITIENFRVDLEQPRDSPFNREAMSIVAKNLITCVKDGWYTTPRIPSRYLKQDYIELSLYNHLKYVKAEYRKLKDRSQSSRMNELKAGARSSRKTRVSVLYSLHYIGGLTDRIVALPLAIRSGFGGPCFKPPYRAHDSCDKPGCQL